jgi:hypothetical protein
MSQSVGRIVCVASWGIWAAASALLLTAGPALGASRESRQSQEKAARKACLTGDYTTGVSILADLFVDHNDPAYVFNQGRCLEQNTRYKEAIARFDEYLRIAGASKMDAAGRTAAEKHIEDCKAKLAAEEKAQVAPQPFAQPLPQPIPQPVSQPRESTPTVEKPKAEPEPAGGRGLVVGGVVTGGVGVAAVVAGLIFNLKANSMVDDMQTKVDAFTADKSSSQKTYATLAWVGYGVGAACIATGAILTVVGASRHGGAAETNVALVPAVSPGQAGVLLQGGF